MVHLFICLLKHRNGTSHPNISTCYFPIGKQDALQIERKRTFGDCENSHALTDLLYVHFSSKITQVSSFPYFFLEQFYDGKACTRSAFSSCLVCVDPSIHLLSIPPALTSAPFVQLWRVTNYFRKWTDRRLSFSSCSSQYSGLIMKDT